MVFVGLLYNQYYSTPSCVQPLFQDSSKRVLLFAGEFQGCAGLSLWRVLNRIFQQRFVKKISLLTLLWSNGCHIMPVQT